MEIKIKKLHPEAVIPTYAKPGDAGLDLTAVARFIDNENNIVYSTGLAIEIPEGYVGLVFPRSSVSRRDLFMSNSVGVIDSGYRGEITIKFKMVKSRIGSSIHSVYNIGDRVGQIIILPYPQIEFIEVEHLSQTDRGTGGYGSTGQ